MVVDCEKLNSDIEELEAEVGGFVDEFSDYSKSEEIDKKRLARLYEQFVEVEAKKNETLEKYVDKFFELFPELMEAKLARDFETERWNDEDYEEYDSKFSVLKDNIGVILEIKERERLATEISEKVDEIDLEKVSFSEDDENSEAFVRYHTRLNQPPKDNYDVKEMPTLDDVESQLVEYLKYNLDLDSEMLVYALKKRFDEGSEAIREVFSDQELLFRLKKKKEETGEDPVKYIFERVRNLETFETENYIFLGPFDKWNKEKVKVPDYSNSIAPSDLTAILKQKVYERPRGNTGEELVVYDDKWVGKQVRHFTLGSDLLKAEDRFLKPHGYFLPPKMSWSWVVNSLKREIAKEMGRNAVPADVSGGKIIKALIERFGLGFSGIVELGAIKYVGKTGNYRTMDSSSYVGRGLEIRHMGGINSDCAYLTSRALSARCMSQGKS